MKSFLLFARILVFMTTATALAQVRPSEIQLTDKKDNPRMIRFRETRITADSNSVKAFLKTQYKADADTDFRPLKAYRSTNAGFTSQKYQQYYQGIPVEFAICNAVSRNDNLHAVTGNYVPIRDLSVTPRLSEAQALEAAKAHIRAESYMWENEANNEFLRQEQNNPNASFFPKGELVIVEKDMFGENPMPVLAYRFDIYASKPVSRNYVYVDAQNGEVVFVNSMIHHANGTANTRYSGTRQIQTEFNGANYILHDITRGSGIETYNMGGGTDFAAATNFYDNDNNWAGEHDNAAKDNAALDAHWGAAMTYDYFLNEHSRNSYDNNGAVIRNYVHYDTNWNNAGWDGGRMICGDGDGMDYDPLTSIDLIAHEISHAVCQTMIPPYGLIYQGESGAINEGLSDIWGAMVENYVIDPMNPEDADKNPYLHNEEIMLNPAIAAERSLQDPNMFEQPDTYQGTYWLDPNCPAPASNDNCGVHTNSGVFNYWFYLLAEGGTGVNDNMDAYDVTGIGKTEAAAILYAVESLYFTPTTNYTDARYLTLQAAADLYGDDSAEYINIYNAWYAVGIGNEYSPPPPPSNEWIKLGQDIDGEAPNNHSGFSVSLNSNGSRVAIGAYGTYDVEIGSGHVRIYEFDGVNWVQLGEDIDGEAANDWSGYSVSLSSDGSRVAIGAMYNDGNTGVSNDNRGHVRVYQFDGLNWNQLGQDINGEAASDQSGWAVSLSDNGNILAVGAPANDGNGANSGHVRVFEWQGGNWIQLGLDIDGQNANDIFGRAVCLNSNGNILAIGAPDNNNNGFHSGHVQVYEFNGFNWAQQGQDMGGEAAADGFGVSVSLSDNGNILAVGAIGNDGNGAQSGHVRIYQFDGVNWNQLGSDIDGEAANDWFGNSLSLSSDGNIVAIGATQNDGNGVNAGHVRVYEFDDVNWNQLGSDIDGEVANDNSGNSICLSSNGNIVAIGAMNNDGDNGGNSGHVRVYLNAGGNGYTSIPDPIFEQVLINQGIDSEGVLDGRVLTSDISGITVLNVPAQGINSLVGIEDFTVLEELNCNNNNLTGLYVGHNTNLNTLYCSGNQINNLDVRENANLITLTCSSNQLLKLDVSNNTNLTLLFCNNNRLSSLDLSGLASLANINTIDNDDLACIQVDNEVDANAGIGNYSGWIIDNMVSVYSEDCNDLYYTYIPDPNFEIALANHGYDSFLGDHQVLTANISGITDLDVSSYDINDLTGIEDFASLQTLICYNNNLTILDVSNNSNLEVLYCFNNQLTNLDVSANTNLTDLRCGGNLLANLTISGAANLTILHCYMNQLTSLNTSTNTNLEELRCYENQLTSLDVSSNLALTSLECDFNQLLTLDVHTNVNLVDLSVGNNNLTGSLDLRGLNQLTNFYGLKNSDLSCISVDDPTGANAGLGIYAGWVKDTDAGYSQNCFYTLIPDPNFEQALIDQGIDSEALLNGAVLTTDISGITVLNISNENISDLTGIEAFTSLQNLDCSHNNLSGSLDFSANYSLISLDCSYNNLTGNLNLGSNPYITHLSVNHNQLSVINVSSCYNLVHLHCQNNQLAGSLFLRQNRRLTEMHAENNPLLSCIEVSSAGRANSGIGIYATWVKDLTASYSQNCGGVMPKGIAPGSVKNTTGKTVEETERATVESLTIYPNPADETLYIAVPVGRKATEVALYNLRGERLMEVKDTVLSVKQLPPGLYFVAVQFLDGKQGVSKVLISRE